MNTTRRWLTHLSAFFFVLFMAFGLTSYADDGMKVHFLNVGQADSTLITCGDHAMLIDAGKNDDKEPILNYIQNKAGLTHLDYMIGTHPHEDHIGSMDSVIEAVSVDTVMLPNVTANTRTFQDVLTAIDEKGLFITVPEVGETYSLGDASFTILGPVSDYGDNLNDWSIALKITYGNTSFIFTGDAEADAEADMLGTGLDLSADVYQVGHHGSRTSSSSALLDAISPRYAVISCGAEMIMAILIRRRWMPSLPETSKFTGQTFWERSSQPPMETAFPSAPLSAAAHPVLPLKTRALPAQPLSSATTVSTARITRLPAVMSPFTLPKLEKNTTLQAVSI